MENPRSVEPFRADIAHIGKSVAIKGQLFGSEDLYLDGEVEGSVELHGHSLTLGPNARVRANVHAGEIIVHGKLDGNLHAEERVELKRTAVVNGDVKAKRLAIEDGAFIKGGISVEKEAPKPQAQPATRLEARNIVSDVVAANAAAAATAALGTILEAKK
ncbi:MAG: polymer-forming cytoskeletal protein [Terriglobales bacterium]